ncbi:hypothetical protein PTI45_01085 [Paenibacillus nuruki]|uniref:SnoaL-like domain-containing protein n=1 Tax=Paenibacillus nuruki TaxID=1886670 RepID=A0A1E3L701_9BACL|nr:polyketide cyclase [Paenibacillus nuruki]ODP29602.1 hypothetical protein PTI45_01085 [Paenibacillus nuruki]
MTTAVHTLNDYFRLFDASRTDEQAMEQLLNLFITDVEIVLNGSSRKGFKNFIDMFYQYNIDIKHMHEPWELQNNGTYESRWAVCGMSSEGTVYAKTGIDIARVNEEGQIVYLENVQENQDAFSKY